MRFVWCPFLLAACVTPAPLPQSDGTFQCEAGLAATFDDRADVLVVVERSPGARFEPLLQAISNLETMLAQQGVDLHVARIDSGGDSVGVAYGALRDPTPDHLSFVRPDALLVVVFVSSRGGCEPPTLPAEYATYFTAPSRQGGLKRNPHEVLLVGVGDPSCVDALGYELRPAPSHESVVCLPALASVDASECVVVDHAPDSHPPDGAPAISLSRARADELELRR